MEIYKKVKNMGNSMDTTNASSSNSSNNTVVDPTILATELVTDLSNFLNRHVRMRKGMNGILGLTYLGLFLTTCYRSAQVITLEGNEENTKSQRQSNRLEEIELLVGLFFVTRFTGGMFLGAMYGNKESKQLIKHDEGHWMDCLFPHTEDVDRMPLGNILPVDQRIKLYNLSNILPAEIKVKRLERIVTIIEKLAQKYSLQMPKLEEYNWNNYSNPPNMDAYFRALLPDQQIRDQFWAIYFLALIGVGITAAATYGASPSKDKSTFQITGPLFLLLCVAPCAFRAGDVAEMMGALFTEEVLGKLCLSRTFINQGEKQPLLSHNANTNQTDVEAGNNSLDNFWLDDRERAAFAKLLIPKK